MALTRVVAAGISTGGNVEFSNIISGVVTSTTFSGGSLNVTGDISGNSLNVTGVITATSFVGDISQATGAAAGLGTALSQDQSNPLNKIYYTDTILSIGSTQTVNPPDSSNIAYTQYAEIAVEEGFDLIVEDGDDLVPDILGLSTGTAAPLAGAGGRVRADNFTNKAGTGAPTFPNGVNVTGVVTATSFSGDGSALTGIDATSLKDSGDTIRVQANTSGAVVTGVLTSTSFSGNVTGNVTGDVTGNLTGNVTGDVNAGVVTATSSIVVGDKFISAAGVGIGSTTTNVGVNTAIGTLIFNSTLGEVQVYSGNRWDTLSNLTFEATGGTEDTTSRSGYKIHTFTEPGSFEVSGGLSKNVEYLVIAGGAGGGYGVAGGGGAGGYRTSNSFPITPGTYTITIGGGGSGGTGRYDPSPDNSGSDSVFGTITSSGGGGGGNRGPGSGQIGAPGGSGGGGGYANDQSPTTAGSGNAGGYSPSEGNPGGVANNDTGGGGGGAGGAGTDATGPQAGPGGPGSSSSINGASTTRAGGGGGGGYSNAGRSAGSGGPGGGGGGTANRNTATSGTANTGSGGGGGGFDGAFGNGGAGGSGIVIIAYPTS